MDRGAVDGSATDKPWKTTEASKGDHEYSGRLLAKTEGAWGLEKEQKVTGSSRPRQARIVQRETKDTTRWQHRSWNWLEKGFSKKTSK